MFSWKKVLFKGVIAVLSFFVFAVAVFFVGMALLTLDPKDRCLDYGGRYDDATKICEK
ncbi:hypothetical protein [Pasteurella multocida]|uniref:hypothetical protein n=1 Tax=Pasteurella multocida TaxID=747 RepID=UPI00244A4D10|nr:hypothetical protein [Pasteurella multocida]